MTSSQNQIRITIRVYESDLDYIRNLSPSGYNLLIREMLRKRVRQLKEKESTVMDENPIGEIDVCQLIV